MQLQAVPPAESPVAAEAGPAPDWQALFHEAGLDLASFTPVEPRSNDDEFISPLRRFDNTFLTPHIGGSTVEAQENIGMEVAEKLARYSDNGTTISSVNFPEVALPEHGGSHRLLHIHHNVPGIMSAINNVFSENNLNISAQFLQTTDAVGYVVMTFIMTCTPISMHNHYGHSLLDTKWVIQCHIAAMFLPSLIAPWLFRLLGIRGMMTVGLLCFCITVLIGWIDTSVNGFWAQLVMLGIGWNFLFISGTALLPSTYREGEQYKAQGTNDGIVFSTQAAASLSAGWAIGAISWSVILAVCLIPVSMMALLLLSTRNKATRQKHSPVKA